MPFLRKFKNYLHKIYKSFLLLSKDYLYELSHHLKLPAGFSFKLLRTEKSRIVISIPLNLIETFVPNKNLQYIFEPDKVHFSSLKSFVWQGDWDLKAKSINDYYAEVSTSYRSVMQIFNEGVSYKQCDEYIEKSLAIQNNSKTSRADTIDELDKYFKSLIELEKNIRLFGYKEQKELGNDPYDEIGVFIGRNGEFIKAEDKFCGTHRFAIAKFLGLKSIPVCILAVHEIWARNNRYLLSGKGTKLQNYFHKKYNQ
ncbi:MAG: hypothetical protein JJU37_17135 [Balneolaceae bacterium]|nr:hypothetical protein [Balneolaceae bacterium]